MTRFVFAVFAVLLCASCGGGGKNDGGQESNSGPKPLVEAPAFVVDSAMARLREQCAFGPRVPGTEAHQLCGDYIVAKFEEYGLAVQQQHDEVTAWNGDRLPMRNIIARLNPEARTRLLVTAHWDSRPWADNDLNPDNHHTPVMAANDGASGVAVMLEMARALRSATPAFHGDGGPTGLLGGKWGIDFVCFDCEDYGKAKWADDDEDHDASWCLGSYYWAANPTGGNRALWGVNLDMVGGRGARFAREGISMHFASHVVEHTWNLAARLGYGHIFVNQDGGYVTDDHLPVNQYLGIPCIDIVPHVDSGDSSFGQTWHTVDDTPENIDPAVLAAVGHVMLTLVCNPIP